MQHKSDPNRRSNSTDSILLADLFCVWGQDKWDLIGKMGQLPELLSRKHWNQNQLQIQLSSLTVLSWASHLASLSLNYIMWEISSVIPALPTSRMAWRRCETTYVKTPICFPWETSEVTQRLLPRTASELILSNKNDVQTPNDPTHLSRKYLWWLGRKRPSADPLPSWSFKHKVCV